MSLIFRVAEMKMNRSVAELETSLRGDGRIYEDVTLRNPLGVGLSTNLMRELNEDGSRGEVRINADFSELMASCVYNESYTEQNGAMVSQYGGEDNSPSLRRKAKLLTRLLIGRPDHTFAELEFNGVFEESDEY